jgi:uncharacterized protein YndB with AHSA1/START domain
MKNISYSVDINAPREKVWRIMSTHGPYEEFAGAGWPGATFQGEWRAGADMKFVSPNQGGTLAKLEEYVPQDHVLAKHIAVLKADGSEDRTSEEAKSWIGTTERYTFSENNGRTTLRVDINTPPNWEKMFNDGWPKALAKLKELAERN